MVILAILAKDPTMLHVFNSGLDLHIFLASKILNKTYEELMDEKNTDPN